MQRRQRILFLLFGVLAAVLFVVDLSVGAVPIPIREVLAALTGSGNDPVTTKIILNIRLLKAVVALLAGAALAVSGLQMQTLFRNPLAGPYVLGISSGASLGVSLFLLGASLLGISFASEALRNVGIVGSAWIGGALILLVIMAVSARLKDIMAILILGMMFGSAASAVVQILQYLSTDSALKSFVIWTMGSLGGVSLAQLGLMSSIVLAGLILSVYLIKPLNLLLLGENYARTMGLNVRITRLLLFVSTTLLAGTVTAFCGPIGFIGIAVPHVARMLTGNADHRILMPASILLGSVTMLLCDIIAQLPGREMVLPVNTVTALLGIPIVVLVIVRNRKIF
ncbi:iron chelate uptake ABC transporter family permease subunit [Alistipes putredinis]|uniref:iron chelate uptake ABC transporter family permease subunit n=1 Tax=Alistipes putredinis TaxID=28117 RepID=UPI003AF19E14